MADLNRVYRDNPSLHANDFDPTGFEWIDCNDSEQSTLSFLRRDGLGNTCVVVLNFTPVPREGLRIGLPGPGQYEEIFNSDSGYYGGSNLGNGSVAAEPIGAHGREYSTLLTLPPLGALILAWRRPEGR